YWQQAFRRHTGLQPGDEALDVACGTAELALIMAKQVGSQGKVYGVDLSPRMVEVGRRKVERLGFADRIQLQTGNALALPFADDRFACVGTGFAMRNVADIRTAVAEMARVTKPGGRVLCLELSHPQSRILRGPYKLYFEKVVPWLGRWAERVFPNPDQLPPYAWLPESLKTFPDQEGLAQIFRDAGLSPVRYINLTGGIVCLHI